MRSDTSPDAVGWRPLAILMVLLLAVGHSAGVQALGWAGMLISRTAERGLVASVESTFGGAEPCAMCTMAKSLRRVEQGANRDPAAPAAKADKQPDLCAPATFHDLPVAGCTVVRPADDAVAELSGCWPAPEPPPPRPASSPT